MPRKKKARQRRDYRYLSVPEVLNPSPEEKDKVKAELIEFYTNQPTFKGDPIEKATDVIEKSMIGWRNCPKTFYDRVRTKSKMGHKGGQNLLQYGTTERKKAADRINTEETYEKGFPRPEPAASAIESVIDHIGRSSIMKTLNRDEKNLFIQRERFYRDEFDFNNSSDYALLLEVIVNEVKIMKLHRMEFEEMKKDDPNPIAMLNFSKMVSEAHTQFERSLKNLGVTRDQRKSDLDDEGQDVASLSMNLDEKLKALKARREWEKQEEDEGLTRKFLRGDTFPTDGMPRPLHNKTPDMDEMSEIIEEAGFTEIESEDDGLIESEEDEYNILGENEDGPS